MIIYSHRIHGVLQQMVVELGLDLILSDEHASVSLSSNEAVLVDVARGLNIEMKKMAASNGNILYKFQRRT